jgi:hypothetical protein
LLQHAENVSELHLQQLRAPERRKGDEAFDVIAQTVQEYLGQLDQRPDAVVGEIARVANNVSAITTRSGRTDSAPPVR